MTRTEGRKLRAFHRYTKAHERLLSVTLKIFLGTQGEVLARLAQENDWENFHKLVYSLEDKLRRRLQYLFNEFGGEAYKLNA